MQFVDPDAWMEEMHEDMMNELDWMEDDAVDAEKVKDAYFGDFMGGMGGDMGDMEGVDAGDAEGNTQTHTQTHTHTQTQENKQEL
jgi:hypothetical protein